MGMDVYGKDPRSEVGKYFRAQVWTWHKLWNYTCAAAPDIIDEKMAENCSSNDGHGFDDLVSKALAQRLRIAVFARFKPDDKAKLPESIAAFESMLGLTDTEQRWNEGQSRVDWATIECFADFLDDCGGFEVR